MQAAPLRYSQTLSIHISIKSEPKSCKQALKEKICCIVKVLFCCGCRKSAPIVVVEEDIPLSPLAKTVIQVCSPRRTPPVFYIERPISPPLPVEISRLISTNSTVTEVPTDGWEEISKCAETWSRLADEKWTALKARRPHEFSFQEIFENSRYICDTISYMIKTPPSEYPEGSETWDTILVCKDSEGSIHSIALYDKATNKLAYIATHPNNVHHNLNQKQIHGAATQIILHLARHTVATNSVLRLKSIESAKPFYEERLKFQYDITTQFDRVWRISAMMLTATKIQSLIDQRVAPYDQIA